MARTHQRVTLAQIAEEANASTATVSNVLNARPGMVGAATRERVLAAAKRRGYRPSRLARQLRKRANLIVSVQLPSDIRLSNRWRVTVSLTLSVVQGISSYARGRGYHVHIIAPPSGQDMPEVRSQVIEEDALDGVVFFGLPDATNAELTDLLRDLHRIGMAAVTVDRVLAEQGMPSVNVDLRPGVRQAAERLKSLSHTRLCYVGDTHTQMHHEMAPRWQILREELQRVKLRLGARNVIDASGDLHAYRATVRLLDRKERPSCIIYMGDHMAMAGIQAIHDRKLVVPRDISVLSFDNAPYAVGSPVPLTTIDQRYFDQGQTLAKALLDQIENRDAPVPVSTLVASRLVERESLGPASGRKM